MAYIITGPKGDLVYWNATVEGARPFDFQGQFRRPQQQAFARSAVFAANGNHSPSCLGGAVTSDAAMDMLFDITGFPLDGMLTY